MNTEDYQNVLHSENQRHQFLKSFIPTYFKTPLNFLSIQADKRIWMPSNLWFQVFYFWVSLVQIFIRTSAACKIVPAYLQQSSLSRQYLFLLCISLWSSPSVILCLVSSTLLLEGRVKLLDGISCFNLASQTCGFICLGYMQHTLS